MKKYISVLLAVLCLCFAGCGDDADEKPKENPTRVEDIDKTATGGHNIFVPDITSENNNKEEETHASSLSDMFVPDITESASADETGDPDSSEAVKTEGKTDKNEPVPETTTSLTAPPIFQTLPEGGVELPDDVWE